MGGHREYFPKIAIYRPGIFVWDIPVTARWGVYARSGIINPRALFSNLRIGALFIENLEPLRLS